MEAADNPGAEARHVVFQDLKPLWIAIACHDCSPVFHELGVPAMRVQYVCTEEEPVAVAQAVSVASVKQSKLDFESSDHQLNLRYTFDTFVVGKSNEFAHAASRAVACW